LVREQNILEAETKGGGKNSCAKRKKGLSESSTQHLVRGNKEKRPKTDTCMFFHGKKKKKSPNGGQQGAGAEGGFRQRIPRHRSQNFEGEKGRNAENPTLGETAGFERTFPPKRESTRGG